MSKARIFPASYGSVLGKCAPSTHIPFDSQIEVIRCADTVRIDVTQISEVVCGDAAEILVYLTPAVAARLGQMLTFAAYMLHPGDSEAHYAA
jgi:hypothetical protein